MFKNRAVFTSFFCFLDIFQNQITTFYEGSKLSQMNQDIAKSRVKYGGSEIQFKGFFASFKTIRRKHLTFLSTMKL